MASYKELFMQEYASVYESAGIVLETPIGKGAKLTMYSYDAKDAASYSRSGLNYEKKGEYTKALAEYKKARQCYVKLLSEADKIEDEDGLSWLIRIFTGPWGLTQLMGSGFDLKAVTRQDTKRVIRANINAVDNQVMMCKDKMKDSKK